MRSKFLLAVSSVVALFTFYRCDSELPVRYSEIRPLPLESILSINATENYIVIAAKYTTPNTCYDFYKSEIVSNDTIITLKIYGRDNRDNCYDIISSITHEDTIYLNTPGFKKLKFWQSDSLYKDTTIAFAGSYDITFPNFFIERGSDSDSSYISFRGRKIHPYLFEIEAVGWGRIGTGITLESINYPRKISFYLMGECGVDPSRIWDKAVRTTIITADIMDTVDVLTYSNLHRQTDTITVSR